MFPLKNLNSSQRIKAIMETLAVFLVVCLTIAKVNSQEVCEKHNNLNNTIEAQNCKVYCCGSCNHRYCCNSSTNRLNQELCVPEDCLAYYDNLQEYHQPEYCFGRFCCGKCFNRYCCSDKSLSLDQSSCPNRETTKTTTMVYFVSETRSNKKIYKIYLSIFVFFIYIVYYLVRKITENEDDDPQELTNNDINNDETNNISNTNVYEDKRLKVTKDETTEETVEANANNA